MTAYLGDKAVGVNTVVEKEVAKTKYGASVDNFLGDVDENGALQDLAPGNIVFNGVKSVGASQLAYAFYGKENFYSFPDLVQVGERSFEECFRESYESTMIYGSLETISGANYAFQLAFAAPAAWGRNSTVKFLVLKRVSGTSVFNSAFNSWRNIQFDEIFPMLEEVSGSTIFGNIIGPSNLDITCSSLKRITANSPLFAASYMTDPSHLRFPYVVYASGKFAKPYSTRILTLHFAAANQSAIEACDGYADKFGASEIYFDLMLSITVNGVVYSREYTIGGYTSWKDTDGNIVYTDATAEPAVGTVVYSDQGTTQVGTVSEVA